MPVALFRILMSMGAWGGSQALVQSLLRRFIAPTASNLAKKATSRIVETGAAKTIASAANRTRNAVPGFVGRHIPESGQAVTNKLGEAAIGAGGLLGGLGGMVGFEHLTGIGEENRGNFPTGAPPEFMPNQEQANLSQLQSDSQLREALDLMGVDIGELNSLLPQPRMVI